MACTQEAAHDVVDWHLDYVGDAIRQTAVVKGAGRIRWSVQTRTGRVQAQLIDSLDRVVSGDSVVAGFYALLIWAEEAPAALTVDLTVESDEKVCYGRTLDAAMADLGFAAFDREMAKNIVENFQEAGPVSFLPNPERPYAWPVTGPISSPFGFRVSPTSGTWERHTGVDIAVRAGTRVLAADAGMVTYAGEYGNYGEVVWVEHEGFVTWYGHLDWINVARGAESTSPGPPRREGKVRRNPGRRAKEDHEPRSALIVLLAWTDTGGGRKWRKLSL